jgi:hypothetical protein
VHAGFIESVRTRILIPIQRRERINRRISAHGKQRRYGETATTDGFVNVRCSCFGESPNENIACYGYADDIPFHYMRMFDGDFKSFLMPVKAGSI